MNNVSSVYEIPIRSLDGSTNTLLKSLEGFVCLHVNIATKTNYQPKTKKVWSYARTSKHLYELQQVHNLYKHKNFSVVGYPCNQISDMELGSDDEILKNIQDNYPFVTFPISHKVEINGQNEHPVWTFLKGGQIRAVDDTPADTSVAASNGQNKAGGSIMRIPNNYEKILTTRSGQLDVRFNWAESPISESIVLGYPSIREMIERIL